MIDLLGHAAYAVIVAGTWLGAKGYAIGWALRVLGGVGWLLLGIRMKMSSIVFWSAVFILVDSIAFVRAWRGNQWVLERIPDHDKNMHNPAPDWSEAWAGNMRKVRRKDLRKP